MKFVNTNTKAELNFTILGKSYKVVGGEEVEIDPAHVPYVIKRGLQLEVATAKPKLKPGPKPKAAVTPKFDTKAILELISKPIVTEPVAPKE